MHVADAPHLRVLRLLRDEGPVSRAELGDRLELPRPRLLAELERLVAAGCIAEAGLAASRGGRRSTLVELHPRLRFAAVDLGASSIDVEVTNGRLEPVAAYSEAADIRIGPEGDPAPGQRAARQGQGRRRVRAARRDRHRRARAGELPRRRAGVAADHAGLGPLSRCASCSPASTAARSVVDNDVNIMAIGERHGGVAHSVDDFLFVKIGTGIGCGIYLAGEVYRGTDGCAGDIGHIQVDAHGPVCSCGNVGCLEALFGGAALARDALAAARSGRLAGAGRAARRQRRGHRHGRRRRRGRGRRHLHPADPRRRPAGRRRAGRAGQLRQPVDDRDRRRAGRSSGHILLAEIRSVVYRRSLPLATGNLPVVLSELGPRAGVVGAAVLASDIAFEQAS